MGVKWGLMLVTMMKLILKADNTQSVGLQNMVLV